MGTPSSLARLERLDRNSSWPCSVMMAMLWLVKNEGKTRNDSEKNSLSIFSCHEMQ